jgi:hypothetical protein
MTKFFFVITSKKIQKIDIIRNELNLLSKKRKVLFLDISALMRDRSSLIYKKIKSPSVKEIKYYRDLISILKNKENSYALDYTSNSLKEILVKFILICFNIKIIKYSAGLKPSVLYNHIDKNNRILKVDQRSFLKKIYDFPINCLNLSKKIILNLVNFFFVKIIMIAGRESPDDKNIFYSQKKKIYTNSYDYNQYLRIIKKKNIKKKNYLLYIDQNLIGHPAFFIEKRKSWTNKGFYKKLNSFLYFLGKKNGLKIKVALHPKNKNFKNLFSKGYSCYYNKTAKLIKDSSHVLTHYSTAVSFGVLFNKPITFLTSNELNQLRPGAQITKLSYELKSQLINIDEVKKKIHLKRKFDKKAYIRYLDKYIKHPKSSGENSFVSLLKNI